MISSPFSVLFHQPRRTYPLQAVHAQITPLPLRSLSPRLLLVRCPGSEHCFSQRDNNYPFLSNRLKDSTPPQRQFHHNSSFTQPRFLEGGDKAQPSSKRKPHLLIPCLLGPVCLPSLEVALSQQPPGTGRDPLKTGSQAATQSYHPKSPTPSW